MQGALTTLLLGDAPLMALITTRVHWMRLPETVKGRPYINLQVVSGPVTYTLDGENDWKNTRVQADIWADGYMTSGDQAGVVETCAALCDVLSGYSGDVGNIRVHSIFVDQARDLSGGAGNAAPLGAAFHRSVDFKVSWSAIAA